MSTIGLVAVLIPAILAAKVFINGDVLALSLTSSARLSNADLTTGIFIIEFSGVEYFST